MILSTLFFIASGSGGHIIPAQEYGKKEALTRQSSLFFLTGNNRLEQQLIPDTTNVMRFPSLALPGKKIWRYPLFIYHFISIFFKSFFLFLKTPQEKKVFTTGGILSIPICLAAYCLRIPIHLIELNAVAGKTTRFLSPLATEILTVFDLNKDDPRYKIIDYPVRRFIIDTTKLGAKKPHTITLALFGGSQGSQKLNAFFLDWLEKRPELFSKIKVYHYYGSDQSIDFKAWYQAHQIDAEVAAWSEHPENIYALSDLVFSRGGSGTLHELLSFKRKTVILPLRSVADDHQFQNALQLAQKYPDLFFVIDQKNNKKLINKFDTFTMAAMKISSSH
jgi:UDP-N-acetylglucosamine--N-acetylmuramyl-(pentapeptide) pyrophosphoryl-undecaprenol N-acetylglucosamine transferase